jgi:hypothetical protein
MHMCCSRTLLSGNWPLRSSGWLRLLNYNIIMPKYILSIYCEERTLWTMVIGCRYLTGINLSATVIQYSGFIIYNKSCSKICAYCQCCVITHNVRILHQVALKWIQLHKYLRK